MQKCVICLHWYEDDQFLNDLAAPTCNDCAGDAEPEAEDE